MMRRDLAVLPFTAPWFRLIFDNDSNGESQRKKKQGKARSTRSAKSRLDSVVQVQIWSKAKSGCLMKELTEEQSISLLNKLDGTLLAVT